MQLDQFHRFLPGCKPGGQPFEILGLRLLHLRLQVKQVAAQAQAAAAGVRAGLVAAAEGYSRFEQTIHFRVYHPWRIRGALALSFEQGEYLAS